MSGTCYCSKTRVYLSYLTFHNPTVLVTRDTSTVNIHVRCSHPTYRTVYCPDRSACQQFPRSHIPSYGVYHGEYHFIFLYFAYFFLIKFVAVTFAVVRDFILKCLRKCVTTNMFQVFRPALRERSICMLIMSVGILGTVIGTTFALKDIVCALSGSPVGGGWPCQPPPEH